MYENITILFLSSNIICNYGIKFIIDNNEAINKNLKLLLIIFQFIINNINKQIN